MKLTIKVLVVVCLLSPAVMADGEMGTPGKTCTSNCAIAIEPVEPVIETAATEPAALVFVRDCLDRIFGFMSGDGAS